MPCPWQRLAVLLTFALLGLATVLSFIAGVAHGRASRNRYISWFAKDLPWPTRAAFVLTTPLALLGTTDARERLGLHGRLAVMLAAAFGPYALIIFRHNRRRRSGRGGVAT